MKTRLVLAVASIVALDLFALGPASAHSLKELETLLLHNEKHFQSVDKAAPDFVLKGVADNPYRLSDLRGKVVVLYFTRAEGAGACPLLSDRIGEIQSMVNQTPMKKQVQFVTIATAPRNKDSRVLGAYGEQSPLDPVNWVLLAEDVDQPDDTTRKLAERFGHNLSDQESGCEGHNIVTHVIDKEGRWRANFYTVKFEPTNLVVFINALVNDAQKPHSHGPQTTWDRIKKRLGF